MNSRSELVFLYDVKYSNPNGDPMNANRPRIDEFSGKCLVTDVRLKRTIRDYLLENGFNGEQGSKGDIFIRDVDGKPVTGKKRSESYKDIEEFKKKFIDVRLFGGVSAPHDSKADKKTFNLTGPVQFGMGYSLNKVKENFIKGTGAFTTKEDSIQKTFREEYNITYGLVGFHGIINENAAKYTGLSDEDIEQMIEALWKGTQNLLTRSKKGHMPRLLVKVDYSEKNFFLGDLLEMLEIKTNEELLEEEITEINDYVLDVSKLNQKLRSNKDKIESISVKHNDELKLNEQIYEKGS